MTVSLLDSDVFELANRLLDAIPEPDVFENFGPYRIERRIGKGGMAEVFLASDATTNRQVAIKFLRYSWEAADLRHRFITEIKTLAQLEHPFIARLYDTGVHPNGTPWFSMEYVEGEALDEHCRERDYSVEDRLRLFRSVCEAVQYAHNRLVVHRDLKPSNIFVRRDGTPKLLDFGIAKQLENLDEAASGTHTQLRFTRAYAAPEQLRGTQPGAYTDVYALGVILYELLTGRLPYDLSGYAPFEAETIIAGSREPDKPSVAADLKNRHNQRLSKTAWKDLDQLCLKAMNKDVHERYASALELGQDVDRFLNGQPLAARPGTRLYRLGKFIRRNRKAVVASSLVATLAIGLTSFFTLRLANARNQAVAEASRAQLVERFMLNLFDRGDRDAGPPESLRVVTLLERGAREAESLRNDPAVQGELFETLGGMYRKLGRFDRAEPLLNAALERRKTAFGHDHQKVADSLVALGLLRIDQARLNEAEPLIREAVAMDRRHLPPGAPESARATAALGQLMNERGQYDQAIGVLAETVRFQSAPGGAKSDLSASLIDLADAHFYLGHYALSESLNQQALTIHRELHGEIHPLVANDLVNLGHIQFQQGRYAEQERYDRRALAISQAWYGKDHPETARDAVYVAQALTSQNRYDEAAALLTGTLATLEQAYGKEHPKAALVLNQLGVLAQLRGNLDEAAADFSRMAEIYRAVYGDRHEMTAVALANIATIYLKQEQYARAEALFRNVIGRFTLAQGATHLNTGIARVKLGRTLVKQSRFREAETETLEGYEILSKQTSPSVNWIVEARRDLVKEYEAMGRPDKASQFRAEPSASLP